MANKPTIKHFGLLEGSNRTLYLSWSWDKVSQTDHYLLWWHYSWGVGETPIEEHTVTPPNTYDDFTPPDHATKVSVYVKPVSKTYKDSKGNDISYWTADWAFSGVFEYSESAPPAKPSAPSISIRDDDLLLVTLENIDDDVESVIISISEDDKDGFKMATPSVKDTDTIRYTCYIDKGHRYRARCKAVNAAGESDWSDWSNEVGSGPPAPKKITTCKATSATSVYLEWSDVVNATSYTLEYATKKEDFDASDKTTSQSGITVSHYNLYDLSGGEYFFRVKAVNSNGESSWSPIVSIAIGEKPSPPTTWSSSTTAKVGETVTLYWTHNSEDGSTQTSAKIELTVGNDIDGYTTTTETLRYNTDNPDDEDVYSYIFDTSEYANEITIKWRVCTKGVLDEYSDYSIQRVIEVYGAPTFNLMLQDTSGANVITLRSFPLYAMMEVESITQSPISYHLSVVSNTAYETTDYLGNRVVVSAGDELFSKHYDTSNELLMVELSANNIDLEDGSSYQVRAIVSMNSGITAEASAEFSVDWDEVIYVPNAEIGYDKSSVTTMIRPYCTDESDSLVGDVMLSVYRREFDGSLTEIVSKLDNTGNTFVTDPHPSLDYARYRITATSKTTGAVAYYDIPAYKIGEKAIIIQWDEAWSHFDSTDAINTEVRNWTGSMLKLPYNIDIAPQYSRDVSMVNYIGRKHPVGYYGTHIGETDRWNTEIPKSDINTIYGLRKLANWMGNVYVREPHGSGYWANVTVSFTIKHRTVTIPVILDVVRVEGDE